MTEVKVPVPVDHEEFYHMDAVTYAMLVYAYCKITDLPSKEITDEADDLWHELAFALDKNNISLIHDHGFPKGEVHRVVAKCSNSKYLKNITVYSDRFVDTSTGTAYYPVIVDGPHSYPDRY